MSELSRRQVLKTALAVAAGAVTGVLAHGYAWERHALGVTRVDLPLSGLSQALDGLRVGFLSDVHHSRLVSADMVAAAVRLLNAERTDLVLLGGDYVSFTERRFMGPVAELLGALTAPHGVFAILGNHDDDRHMPAALRRHHIETLDDQRTSVQIRGARLALAGLNFWTRRMDEIVHVLRGAEPPVLLLAHDPRRVVEAAALDVAGILAGHTHGGQIVLPGLGALAARKFPVASGRLTREGTEMFVSRGVGTVVVPIRISCPPEVVVATLRQPARQGIL